MAADLLAFPFIGGRPALNFIGTLGKRGTADLERLRTPADLARWGTESGLLRAGFAADDAGLHDARLLREAMYRLVLDRASASPEDVALVNEWAARDTPVPALVLQAGSLRRNDPAAPTYAVLAAVARDAIDLLTGPEASSIRQCEDSECTLLFLDTSRSHRRRWCSMNSCGARAKMRTLRSPALD